MAEADRLRATARYRQALAKLPAPGHGAGLHAKLLGVANRGVQAGISPEQIVDDLRRNVPNGDRSVATQELREAVERAVQDNGRPSSSIGTPLRGAQARVKPELRDHLISVGRDWDERRIISSSPVPIPDGPAVEGHGVLLLRSVYDPDEVVFIGGARDTTVRPVAAWVDAWGRGDQLGPHVIPNPLTGRPGCTKTGKPSFRADDCVARFRFCMAEFDDLAREEQLAFWAAVELPIVALIDSGGKSIHAWIRVDQADREAWQQRIERELYAERLIPLGVDPVCRTEARLSRMPGVVRPETGRWQRLIYLAPQGRRIAQ